jgi:two-component system LytT family sensor kinase
LVENAVKRNIVSVDQPLRIDISSTAGYIIVSNNLQLKNVPEPSTKIGLENINQRYIHLTGRPVEVDSDGNTFSIKLPVYEYFSDRR